VVGEVACGEADAVGLQPLLGEVGAGDADAGLGGAAGGGGDVVGLGPQPRVRGAVERLGEGGEGAAVDGVREAGGDGELHAAAGAAERGRVDQPAGPGDVEEVVADLAGRAPAAGRDESLGVHAVALGEEPEQFLDLGGGGAVVDRVGELVPNARDGLVVGVAAGDRHGLGLAADDVDDGVEAGEFAAVGDAGDVHGRGDREALLRDLRLGGVLRGLREGGGGAAGDLLGADAAALAVHHQRGHACGDAAGGGGGDGFDVDGRGLLGGGLRGGGAVHAGLELGELVGDAGLFQ